MRVRIGPLNGPLKFLSLGATVARLTTSSASAVAERDRRAFSLGELERSLIGGVRIPEHLAFYSITGPLRKCLCPHRTGITSKEEDDEEETHVSRLRR